jgi:hypothetical protein
VAVSVNEVHLTVVKENFFWSLAYKENWVVICHVFSILTTMLWIRRPGIKEKLTANKVNPPEKNILY